MILKSKVVDFRLMDMSLGGITVNGEIKEPAEKYSAEPDCTEMMMEQNGTPSESYHEAKKRRFQDLQQRSEDSTSN